MENTIIVVDKEPYCIWEININEKNIEFLNSIDVDFFDYILKQHIESKDEKRASVALQLAYHHALETLFSYIGSYVQAPDCSYAWIGKCNNTQLREVINKINKKDNSLFTKLNISEISWDEISTLVFKRYHPDTEKQKETIKLFSNLWTRLAHDFIDENHIYEFNSMKHGFRVSSGGFGLSVGLEHEYGVQTPKEETKMIGHSDYGVSFLKMDKVGSTKGNRSLRSRRHSINWKVDKTIILLQLIGHSINNIVGALKIANGEKASSIKFIRPESDDLFEKVWCYSTGIKEFHYGLYFG